MNGNELPAVVRAYLTAHAAKDDDAALRAFAPDAAVTDEGNTFHGTEEIAAEPRPSGPTRRR